MTALKSCTSVRPCRTTDGAPRGRQAGPVDEFVGGFASGVDAAQLLCDGDLVAVDAGDALAAALRSLLS